MDESDDDINHLSGIRNGPEFAMNVDPPLSSSPLPAVNFGAGAAPLNVIAADADLNPADVDGDRRSPEAGVVSPEEEEKFRKRLAFFFMDPVQKYKAKKNIPWKLTFQIVKVGSSP